MKTRKEIHKLLNKLNLTGTGVEIGVRLGRYSEYLLKNTKLSKLYSVDPWVSIPRTIYYDIANTNQLTQTIIYFQTIVRLSRFKTRSIILRMFSIEASSLFQDNSLDFVYIDANHSYEGCKEDIKTWYPKVKKGGILAGHDYLNGIMDNTLFGVKRAVDEVFEKVSKTDESPCPSWYIIKWHNRPTDLSVGIRSGGNLWEVSHKTSRGS